MNAVRSGELIKQQGIGVAGGTNKLALDSVAVAIESSGRPNPSKDYEGNNW